MFPSAAIHARLTDLVKRCAVTSSASPGHPSAPVAAHSAYGLSGALSRALCLIHRLQEETRGGLAFQSGGIDGPEAGLGPSSSSAVVGLRPGQGRPRLLVVLGGPDATQQYINVMNSIFSAQRAQVCAAWYHLLAHATLRRGAAGRPFSSAALASLASRLANHGNQIHIRKQPVGTNILSIEGPHPRRLALRLRWMVW